MPGGASDINMPCVRLRCLCVCVCLCLCSLLDAFVRLIALLVKHSGDQQNTITKVNLLNKVSNSMNAWSLSSSVIYILGFGTITRFWESWLAFFLLIMMSEGQSSSRFFNDCFRFYICCDFYPITQPELPSGALPSDLYYAFPRAERTRPNS